MAMPDVRIEPLDAPFDVAFPPPGSKSLTNRAMVIAALCPGEVKLTNVLFADDTAVMIDSLRKLGFAVDIDEANAAATIVGQGGVIPAKSAELFCGNSGTTIRFVTALCSLGRGTYSLDGVARMRQRPIGELVAMLKNLGGRIEYLSEPGFPPLQLRSNTLPGGLVRFGAAQSSQYLSAVLMAAPLARNEVVIDLERNQTSWPYVAMTMQLMSHFGQFVELTLDPETKEPTQINVPLTPYHATDYAIEPDASNASYFLAAAAVMPGSRIKIEGLGRMSLQGDVGFADLLRRMGATVKVAVDSITLTGPDSLEAIDADLSAMPDVAQTLAVVALFAEGESVLRGVRTLRVKETDRLAALQNELTKLGAKVDIDGDDVLKITPPKALRSAEIATYDDHRMAMSFSIAGLKRSGITIKDAECVNKTYPRFFEDLARLRS